MRHVLERVRHRGVLRLAVVVAILVGTVLNLINQYELLLGAPLTPPVAAQLVLTYCVPFLVSLHGQASGSSIHRG